MPNRYILDFRIFVGGGLSGGLGCRAGFVGGGLSGSILRKNNKMNTGTPPRPSHNPPPTTKFHPFSKVEIVSFWTSKSGAWGWEYDVALVCWGWVVVLVFAENAMN